MASWREFVAAEPEFAAQVGKCFAVRKHATLATLRRDGAPRISGTEVEFDEDTGEVILGMMPGSLKARDLRRDPRLALHSPTVDPTDDPSAWPGEAKLAGRAVELSDPTRLDEAHKFRIDVTEVVVTTVEGDMLVVQSWHPGRGIERRSRK